MAIAAAALAVLAAGAVAASALGLQGGDALLAIIILAAILWSWLANVVLTRYQ
jgi:hypothetical protein